MIITELILRKDTEFDGELGARSSKVASQWGVRIFGALRGVFLEGHSLLCVKTLEQSVPVINTARSTTSIVFGTRSLCVNNRTLDAIKAFAIVSFDVPIC